MSVRYAGGEQPALADVTLDVVAGEKLAVIGESGLGQVHARPRPRRAPASREPDFGRTPLGGRSAAARDATSVTCSRIRPAASTRSCRSARNWSRCCARTCLSSRAAARARAAALLARVRIPDPERALAAYPHQFSGGQAQRIAIALAIAAGPRLLIADEATSALDVLVQAEIVSLLRELSDDAGMTLLFITHDIALAGTLADRVAVLHDARLVEGGAGRAGDRDPARALYARARSPPISTSSSPRLVGPRAELRP